MGMDRLIKSTTRCFLRRDFSCHLEPQSSKTASSCFVYDSAIADAVCEQFNRNIVAFDRKLQILEQQRFDFQVDKKRRAKIGSIVRFLSKCLESEKRQLVIVGSQATFLAGKKSDLDTVLIMGGSESDNQFSELFREDLSFRRKVMYGVQKLLRRNVNVENVTVLLHARVPIVTFVMNGVHVDIQFNNAGSIYTSLFIKRIASLNSSFPVLMNWMSSNMKKAGLKDSRSGLFSTFHLCSLVIHFMTAYSALPDLISNSCELAPNQDWRAAASRLDYFSSATPAEFDGSVDAAELLVHMVAYYAQLDLNRYAIDVQGKTKIREDCFDGKIIMTDPYMCEAEVTRCNVVNGTSLLNQHFTSILHEFQRGQFRI